MHEWDTICREKENDARFSCAFSLRPSRLCLREKTTRRRSEGGARPTESHPAGNRGAGTVKPAAPATRRSRRSHSSLRGRGAPVFLSPGKDDVIKWGFENLDFHKEDTVMYKRLQKSKKRAKIAKKKKVPTS